MHKSIGVFLGITFALFVHDSYAFNGCVPLSETRYLSSGLFGNSTTFGTCPGMSPSSHCHYHNNNCPSGQYCTRCSVNFISIPCSQFCNRGQSRTRRFAIAGGTVSIREECHDHSHPILSGVICRAWGTLATGTGVEHNSARCIPGFYRAADFLGQPGVICRQCPQGRVQMNYNFEGTSCNLCTGNQVANSYGTACVACPDGTLPDAERVSCVGACPDGQYAVGAAGACRDCPALPAPNAAVPRNSILPRRAAATNAARNHCYIRGGTSGFRTMTDAEGNTFRFQSDCRWVYNS